MRILGQSKARTTALRRRAYGCGFVGLVLCSVLFAQTPPSEGENHRVPYARQVRQPADPEKTSHVAATAEQIRTVLVKDPGLLVELERIVEKEAIAKGQLVEDSDLTEEAIFERLGEDVSFRATATRLLQRYGYLLPTVNPDSELGKEQELVLKERARRLVQVEAQEDAESTRLRTAGNESTSLANATSGNCNAGNSRDCGEPSA